MAKTKCSAKVGSISFSGFTPPKPCTKVATVIETHTVAPFVSPAGKDFNREGGTYTNAYCDRHKHSAPEVAGYGMKVEKL
jgi:hypothetical protein